MQEMAGNSPAISALRGLLSFLRAAHPQFLCAVAIRARASERTKRASPVTRAKSFAENLPVSAISLDTLRRPLWICGPRPRHLSDALLRRPRRQRRSVVRVFGSQVLQRRHPRDEAVSDGGKAHPVRVLRHPLLVDELARRQGEGPNSGWTACFWPNRLLAFVASSECPQPAGGLTRGHLRVDMVCSNGGDITPS